MKKLIMTKGLPGCGKTTFAKEYQKTHPNTVRTNKDEMRSLYHNGIHSKGRESYILSMRDMAVSLALQEGHDVIVDDTNLNPIHEEALRELAKQHNAEFEVKDFTHMTIEECIRNDQKRPNYVGEKVIRQQYRQWLKQKPIENEYVVGLPNAILCDIDGTLALFGENNPYERDFLQDKLNIPVHNILIATQRTFDQAVILVSGRSGKFMESTHEWLKRNKVNYDRIYMRAEDDKRKDVEVKKEIYEEHIKGKFNVIFVLDDRDQIVEFWRSQGLVCMQVAYGDF